MNNKQYSSVLDAENPNLKYDIASGELFNMLNGWKIDNTSNRTIKKIFQLQDFEKVMDFVYDIAQVAVNNGYKEEFNKSQNNRINPKSYQVKIEVSKSDNKTT